MRRDSAAAVVVRDNGTGSSSEDELHPEGSRASKKGFSHVMPTAGRLDADAQGKVRLVDVGVFPMGIDVDRLDERRQESEVADWISLLKEKYKGMSLIVGRDKLDDIQVCLWPIILLLSNNI